MGLKKHPVADLPSNTKKRPRVGFSDADAGVEAKDCIKIYFVSSKEEVDASGGFVIDPVGLDGYFGKDGKIYGYQGLKITVWISSTSFHAYADIAYDSTSDGGKGITNLRRDLEEIFGLTLVESKDEFLQTFSTKRDLIRSIVSNGKMLRQKTSNGHVTGSDSHSVATCNVEVVRMVIGEAEAGSLYGLLVPLVLLLVDGIF
ncbi:Histone acetyltransferase type B, catalytic subunit [Parasponia andersonii]|uniref:histone acetyltransferase n=1 Tax=Parasponia andersonii TaxID=3476 RepID=A0A2P5A6W9_PARAD|nr:Histone acetyltransferase type B, catalytic subunit [Parasponia andersonii]